MDTLKKLRWDRRRVYTSANADELRVGDKVLLADNMECLREKVSCKIEPCVLLEIRPENEAKRFRKASAEWYEGQTYALAFLVSERTEKMYRPFKDTKELKEYYQKMVGTELSPLLVPQIWVKSRTDKSDNGSMILGFAITMVYMLDPEPTGCSLENLLDKYTFMDGTPCGAEI